jgi:hypothetical protein
MKMLSSKEGYVNKLKAKNIKEMSVKRQLVKEKSLFHSCLQERKKGLIKKEGV